MTKTLRAWRAEQLLSTRRLAALSGSSNKTIVQIENGRQTPTFATIEKISRVLKVEPRDVTEFALALAERGREPLGDESIVWMDGPPPTHVLCVSVVASFLTVSRRLIAAGRYGVTSVIGLPVTAEQIACLQPDLVVLDAGADAPLTVGLVQRLRANAMTTRLPIIMTGRDRRRLEDIVAGLTEAERHAVTLAPFDRDLRELVATVDSVTSAKDAEPTEVMVLQPTA
ncbi:MAG TPA: helix-turn-helix domain-containing protein [Thermomicrobiales bacterium]|nr:helix-turn-helix domain-containing protein [Thermomicrobiales bacterium]